MNTLGYYGPIIIIPIKHVRDELLWKSFVNSPRQHRLPRKLKKDIKRRGNWQMYLDVREVMRP